MTNVMRSLGFFAAALIAVVLASMPSGIARSVSSIPLAPAHEYVAIADRPVCSVLGFDAGVKGQDGSASIEFLGKVFWGFADSYVNSNSGPPNQPNGLGYGEPPATDDAADCVHLQHARDTNNVATPILPKEAGECTIWPLGLMGVEAPKVHFFYVPISNCDSFGFPGVGLASFDGTQIPAFPSVREGLVWPNTAPTSLVSGAGPFVGGIGDGYLYLGLHGPTPDGVTLPFANTARLARVPNTTAALEACVPESAPECELEYWNPSTTIWETVVSEEQSIFTARLGLNGGVTFGYSSGLDKWTATYAGGPLSTVRMRTATEPTAPWGAEETLLSYCPYFFLPGFGYCYTGTLHPQYETNGGETLYITMATNRFVPVNGVPTIDDYSVFLHEIMLGRPVTQSVNSANERRYRIGSTPAGFSAEGTAFYAATIPVPGFNAISEWTDPATNDVLLAAAQPSATHTQQGATVFYAPLRRSIANFANAYEPVYRWDKSPTEHAYLPLTGLESEGYVNAGIAFYTVCGDVDQDYLSDCVELNYGSDEAVENINIDGDCFLTPDGSECQLDDWGNPVPLSNAQSVGQDDIPLAHLDNCPLVANPLQENSDSGDIATGAVLPDISNPRSDILGDACDDDIDNDRLTNAQEAAGCNSTGATEATLQDTDGDHFIDGYECLVSTNPNDKNSRPLNPAPALDPDSDRIPSTLETLIGSNPNVVDTDGDGLNDGMEVRNWGLDPTRADSDGDSCGDRHEAVNINNNHQINVVDLGAIAQHIGPDTPGSPYHIAFDVNRDGSINVVDLQMVAATVPTNCIPPRHIARAGPYGATGP